MAGRVETFPSAQNLLQETRFNMRQDRLRKEQFMRETPQRDAFAIREIGNLLPKLKASTRYDVQEGMLKNDRWNRIRQRNPQWFDKETGHMLHSDTSRKDALDAEIDAAKERQDKQGVIRLMGLQETPTQSAQSEILGNVRESGRPYSEERSDFLERSAPTGEPKDPTISDLRSDFALLPGNATRDRQIVRFKEINTKIRQVVVDIKKYLSQNESAETSKELGKHIRTLEKNEKFINKLEEADNKEFIEFVTEILKLNTSSSTGTTQQSASQQPSPPPTSTPSVGTQAQNAVIDLTNWAKTGGTQTYDTTSWDENTVVSDGSREITIGELAKEKNRSVEEIKDYFNTSGK